jgi:hypothetical protein
MTTPQNPGDGDTPQDPSDPQNPYGTPPPPPPSTPPTTPPATPPATPPPPPPPPPADQPPVDPPPADPGPTDPATAPVPPVTPIPAAPPTYGDPAVPPGAPAAPPPYGQPGQPGVPGQPAYAAPGYAGPMPGPAEPSKGMAITALIASILGCTCIGILVAVPLAIIVLVRSRGGQNYGKGLAIAALVISLISAVGLGFGGYKLYDYAKDFKSVEDLSAGTCITAKGLTDASASGVTEIRSVGCTAKHDGEVLSTSKLTADEAGAYGSTSPAEVCTPSVTAAGSVDLLANPDLVIIALTQNSKPSSGDKLVCVIANADGSKLTSKLGS